MQHRGEMISGIMTKHDMENSPLLANPGSRANINVFDLNLGEKKKFVDMMMAAIREISRLMAVEEISGHSDKAGIEKLVYDMHRNIMIALLSLVSKKYEKRLKNLFTGELGHALREIDILRQFIVKHAKRKFYDVKTLAPRYFAICRLMYKRTLGSIYKTYEPIFLHIFPSGKASALDHYKGNLDLMHHEIVLVLLSIITMKQQQVYMQFLKDLIYMVGGGTQRLISLLEKDSYWFVIDNMLRFSSTSFSKTNMGLDSGPMRLDLLIIALGKERVKETILRMERVRGDSGKRLITPGYRSADKFKYSSPYTLVLTMDSLRSDYGHPANFKHFFIYMIPAIPNVVIDREVVAGEISVNAIIELLYPDDPEKYNHVIHSGDWSEACLLHMSYACPLCRDLSDCMANIQAIRIFDEHYNKLYQQCQAKLTKTEIREDRVNSIRMRRNFDGKWCINNQFYFSMENPIVNKDYDMYYDVNSPARVKRLEKSSQSRRKQKRSADRRFYIHPNQVTRNHSRQNGVNGTVLIGSSFIQLAAKYGDSVQMLHEEVKRFHTPGGSTLCCLKKFQK